MLYHCRSIIYKHLFIVEIIQFLLKLIIFFTLKKQLKNTKEFFQVSKNNSYFPYDCIEYCIQKLINKALKLKNYEYTKENSIIINNIYQRLEKF